MGSPGQSMVLCTCHETWTHLCAFTLCCVQVTHLNAAQSGAVVSDCPPMVAQLVVYLLSFLRRISLFTWLILCHMHTQVDYIVKQLHTTYAFEVDFDLDWKVCVDVSTLRT